MRILPYTGEFNYSAMNNMAAAEARRIILGLINDDIEVISQDWLSEMVSSAVLDEIGAVGAKLCIRMAGCSTVAWPSVSVV